MSKNDSLINSMAERGYQGLNPDGKEIRVVEIYPSPPGNQGSKHYINCHTSIIRFQEGADSTIPYRALSYTWGNLTMTVPILLDDQEIQVTENLAHALQHLEKSHPKTMFWIDAICIDQSNEVEKSQQVGIMGVIFKKAVEVIVWIGPGDEGSAEALRVLRQVGQASQEVLQSCVGCQIPRDARKAREYAEWEDKHGSDDNMLSAVGCRWFPEGVPKFDSKSVTKIFQRPWFRRVWVLQEAAINTHVTFHCGEEALSKLTFWAGARAIIALSNDAFTQAKRARAVDDPLWQTVSGANFISRRTMDLVRIGKGGHTLEQLLLETSTNLGGWAYEASDPRDRIFALLSLSSDLAALGIESNYERPCKDIYTTAAEAILMNSDTIDILYTVTWPKNVQCIPSWCPDWSTSIPASFGLRSLGRFSASGKASRASPVFSSDRYGNRILTLQGYRVDTVRAVFHWRHNTLISDGCFCESTAREFVDVFQELALIETAVYPTEYLRSEALWRTPIADCDAVFSLERKCRPTATAQMKESFDALMTLGEQDIRWNLTARAYLHVMKLVSARRRLFVSDRGYIGLGAETLRTGDTICLIHGGDSPLIIRDTGLGCHKLVGEAYVHGIMHGEFLKSQPQSLEFRLS